MFKVRLDTRPQKKKKGRDFEVPLPQSIRSSILID